MGSIEQELADATIALSDEIASAMLAALESGDYSIGATTFESELAVCPIVAAAKTLGIWINGGVAAGNPVWGTGDEMSSDVEEFAGWFDLCAQEQGLHVAIAVVLWALTPPALAPVTG